jgi:hypothetical protein
MVHVLHATEMAAENRGWRRSGSLEAGVSAVIKRLSWWFLGGAVAGVVHEEKMKTSAEVREEETVAVSGVGVAGLWLG